MTSPRAGLKPLLPLILLIAWPRLAEAQRELAGYAAVRYALDRLNVLGSVLMIAAHPDDENTALLAYLARGRKLRTAYLSLTRGEGGQNLIGPEQGELLGVIRTQELLAARRIDGAEQYFTRAIDFGYSKTTGETLAKWNKEEVLSDMAWVIRGFRPDVIVLRFSGTDRDGHGHHQASALLGKEAFEAAADPRRFPEQLRWVRPWRARRLLWSVFSFRQGRFSERGESPDRLDVDTGAYDPVSGFSYSEIAGMSRSQHRSQGFGAPERKGSALNSLVLVAGEPAAGDLLDGVDTTWGRVPGAEGAAAPLRRAAKELDPLAPSRIVPLLLEARKRIAGLDHPWAEFKRRELDDAIALCAGLWLDVTADHYFAAPGSQIVVRAVALNRSRYPVELSAFEMDGAGRHDVREKLDYNRPRELSLRWRVPAGEAPSMPWWLRRPPAGALYQAPEPRMIGLPDSPPARVGRFTLRLDDEEIVYDRPLQYRWVDRVRGERTRPVAVTPPVALEFPEPVVMFPDEAAKEVPVRLTANVPAVEGTVRLEGDLRRPGGWASEAPSAVFRLTAPGEQTTLRFRIRPPRERAHLTLTAQASAGGSLVSVGARSIDYEHIPPQTLALPATVRLVRVDAKTRARTVGYVMGAGDEVPRALAQLGCEIALLSAGDLASGDLDRFDAIVTGVRAYNVRPDVRANQERLLQYVERGGTLVVQYNVAPRRFFTGADDELGRIGPYPLRIGSARVSVEEAPMTALDPDHPLLQAPNRITTADFAGWVQERGLYFAEQWDERYTPLWEASDPGEPPQRGATLYARHGKGVYVYTGLSFFRQLPAGVPGAYRLFANFVSAK